MTDTPLVFVTREADGTGDWIRSWARFSGAGAYVLVHQEEFSTYAARMTATSPRAMEVVATPEARRGQLRVVNEE